ncbi:SDR family NAD(P)-dependent oxidoreductase [Pseudoalteromonas rubra]|uniref:Short-chain dehydrogenase n=1 Tax=Pseudoalteromonas rubra TaxID=43658 RepID=A0A0U3HWA1_9GAMM|nr:SDR family oxidoreductase [Pseudoalteromonas rubra]ALU45817.1 hypothetical protein AT705_23095 [Pseudoalteromonas rubra]
MKKNNKYAVITGASSGIGYALSCQVAMRGYNVILIARDTDRLETVSNELVANYGVGVITLAYDLTCQSSIEQLKQALEPYIDEVEVFINNAGVGLSGEFVGNSLSEQYRLLDINIKATVTLSHFIAKHFIAKKRGYIMNVASLAAFQPGPYYSSYYATKSYILHFTEGLAVELKKHNVICSALCPGTTDTPFHHRAGSTDTGLAKGLFGIVMSANEVAAAGVKGLFKKRVVVVPGIVNKIAMFSIRLAPRWLARQITAQINQ